jgi:hypothetical protein
MSFIKSIVESLLAQSTNGSTVATGAEQPNGFQPKPTHTNWSSPVEFKSGPRVLLVDVNDDVVQRLKKERFPVHAGSFGPIVSTKRSAHYRAVKKQSRITEHQEQDIVVVNLLVDPLDDDPTVHDDSPEVEQLWAPCENGLIDYRPLAMWNVQGDFDRILAVGGVIIVFAQRRIVSTYQMGYCKFNDLRLTGSPIEVDNYAFLSILRDVVVHNDRGRDCTSLLDGTEYASSPLAKFVRRHLAGFSFQCTMGARSSAWLPLVGNRYGATVAGALLPIEGLDGDVVVNKRRGSVFIFPEVTDQATFLADFVTTVLPLYSPELFPEEDGEHWIHRPEYEEPRVVNILNEIKSIEEQARAKVESLRLEIERAQDSYVPMYNLLSAQGDDLVDAVKYSLSEAGFEHIIDADEEIRATGKKNAPLNEDLRVEDAGPLLLIEIKGIHGHVPDAEALQVWKYIAPRMKLLKRSIRSAFHMIPSVPLRRQSLAPEVFHGTAYPASIDPSRPQVAAYRRRMARQRFERPRVLRKEWAQKSQDVACVEQ